MAEEILRIEKNRNRYPKDLQILTEHKLYQLDLKIIAITGGKYFLKHDSAYGKHGFITIQNALKDRWIVENEEGELHLHYYSLTDLVNDGWVLD